MIEDDETKGTEAQGKGGPASRKGARDRSAEETYSIGASSGPAPAPVHFSSIPGIETLEPPAMEAALERWDRYEVKELLGAGGMGKVYKAWDPRLKRFVALKFLVGESPEMIERFVKEAQIQAGIEHPGICKVYEVGAFVTHPFIAMQYIEGRPLGEAAASMTLEQKTKVIEDVALAVQAAHRQGLIHRDIKPSNILVETAEDGRPIPYVMDFGIAKQIQMKGVTMTGVVMGTASYMSPEQARGEADRLDRRTDVYSLGATFYEILTGVPPFDGATGIEVLLRVTQEEAVPLAKLAPSLPRDLDTIVMKCLEKDPQRRYDSMRAFADDLERYLMGEPIAARRASLAYRVAKRVQKNRATFAVGAVALLLTIVLLGLWGHARWTAARTASLARAFGQDVERMEGILRAARTMPLHDTRPEVAMVRQKMDEIRRSMDRLGGAAQAPGHYALGRGFLALDQNAQAREEISKAWELGMKEPEVAYALGQAMGRLYAAQLDELRRVPGKEAKEARRKELQETLRDPALGYLKAAAGARTESPAYAEGLIALYEERYADAAAKARAALVQVPWLYEAKKLEGDALLSEGRAKQDKGDAEGALAEYAKAGDAYASACDMARSDAAAYVSDGKRWSSILWIEKMRGGDPAEAYKKALGAYERALAADPASVPAFNQRSLVQWMWGEHLMATGQDPREVFSAAAASAQKAAELDPKYADAYNAMGLASWRLGEYEMGTGGDPGPSLNRAIASFQKAVEVDPALCVAYNNLGIVYAISADEEIAKGQDPGPTIDKAVASYRKALDLQPNLASTNNNLGNAYGIHAGYLASKGKDPGARQREAIEAYTRAATINPNLPQIYNNLALIQLDRADFALAVGKDPMPDLEEAGRNFRKAVSLNPKYATAIQGTGEALARKGEARELLGQDGLADYESSIRAFREALVINPNTARSSYLLARVLTREGLAWAGRGRDPSAAYAEAARTLSAVAGTSPDLFHQGMAEVQMAQARWESSRGRSPEALLLKARETVGKALEVAPGDAWVLLKGARCERLRAAWLASEGRDASREAQQGLDFARRALEANPLLQEAAAEKSALEVLLARGAGPAVPATADAARAAADLKKLLDGNPYLRREYLPYSER